MIKEVFDPSVTGRLTIGNKEISARLRSFYLRWFFVIMASTFPLMALMGFLPDYVLMYKSGLRAHWFAHVHGAIMTSWLIIFLIQAIFAAKGNLKYHRKLGLFSMVLGVVVWLSTVAADVRARIANSPVAGDNDSWNIFFLGIYASTLFVLFFTWGMLTRKNAAVHKRLLLLATIVTMGAAVDRIRFLPGMAIAVYVRFLYLDLLLIPLFIYDLLTVKRIHKITLIGTTCLLVFQLAVAGAWDSPRWHKFAFSFFKPFMEQPVEIKLSDAQTQPLIGDYGDKKWHLNISRVGGKLYLKLPDQEGWEMGATSETEWFLKTMTWRATFIKSAEGNVTKIVNRQPGIIWEAPRIK